MSNAEIARALALLCDTRERAHWVLLQAKYPREWIPQFNGPMSAMEFWRHVCTEVEGGKLEDLEPVVRAALEEYRSYQVLTEWIENRAHKQTRQFVFEAPNVQFAQIGGYEEVKAELLRALKLMVGAYRLPEGMPNDLQQELIPRGFLFYGPPGTGKTLFAKAVAGLLCASIRVVSAPKMTDGSIRELFAEARRNVPAVVVFDEFDSIASKRSGRDDGGSRAGNAIVTRILTEMDGFRPDAPVFVIGTTNRLDVIDEALLRPGRFRPIQIGLPNAAARRAIAEIHATNFRVDVPPGLLDVIAQASEGLNGDEIRSVFRDACVGMYCQNPPVPADARRLGFLLGQLLETRQKRALEFVANRLGRASARDRGYGDDESE